ncbi:MAG: hypothetical protein IT318_02895 [Anaerolineales bacterium]|nr:hypothetical protein [Anaerolineales bacterium]
MTERTERAPLAIFHLNPGAVGASPGARDQGRARRRLAERLDHGRSVAWVVAPAGFGKTPPAAAWAAAVPTPGWLAAVGLQTLWGTPRGR